MWILRECPKFLHEAVLGLTLEKGITVVIELYKIMG